MIYSSAMAIIERGGKARAKSWPQGVYLKFDFVTQKVMPYKDHGTYQEQLTAFVKPFKGFLERWEMYYVKDDPDSKISSYGLGIFSGDNIPQNGPPPTS